MSRAAIVADLNERSERYQANARSAITMEPRIPQLAEDLSCQAWVAAFASALADEVAAKAEIHQLRAGRIDVDGSAPELRSYAAAQAAVEVAKKEAFDEVLVLLRSKLDGVAR